MRDRLGVKFVDLSSDSGSPENNPYQDYDTLKRAHICHLECMTELRRKIWVVESEIDSVLRGDGVPFSFDLNDHIASLRMNLLDL